MSDALLCLPRTPLVMCENIRLQLCDDIAAFAVGAHTVDGVGAARLSTIHVADQDPVA